MKGIYAHRYFFVPSKLLVLVALVVGTTILAPAALAQYGDPLTEYGFKPFGSFDNGEIDSVNLVNLELNLHIPLGPTYPQRGKMFSAGFQVTYTANAVGVADPKSWDCSDFSQGNPCDDSINPPPPSEDTTNTGGLNIQAENLFVGADQNEIWTSDGGIHEYANVPSLGAITLDASGFVITNSGPGPVKNGSGVSNTSGSGLNLVGYTDTNGNTFANGANSITDTIGRPLPDLSGLPSPTALNEAFSNYPLEIWTGINPSGPEWAATSDYTHCTGTFPTVFAVKINFPSVYDTPAQYEICYTNVYVSPGYVWMEDVTEGGTLPDGYYQRGQYVSPPLVEIQSIVLPNHTAYTFTYDGNATSADLPPPQPGLTGDLLKITLPTGGSISYTWDYPKYPPGTGVWDTVNPVRILTSRTVDANDGTGPHTWTYKMAPGPGDNQWVNGGPSDFPYLTIVTDPLGNDTVHMFTDVDMADDSGTYYETNTQYYQGSCNPSQGACTSGTLLKTVATHYSYSSWSQSTQADGIIFPAHAINVVPDKITTMYPDGTGLLKTLQYDQGYQLANDDWITENAYGIVGNVTSETDVNLSTGATLSSTTNTYYTDPTHINAGLLHLLYESKVAYGSGNTDTLNYYDPDGNLTSRVKTVDSTGATLTSNFTYTPEGMLQTSTDPNLNKVTIDYDGTGFYPKDIQQPAIPGAPAPIDYYSYDANTGNLLYHTDENGSSGNDPAHTTSYDYHEPALTGPPEPLGRLTQVTYPPTQSGQGQVNIAYDDSLLTVTTTALASPDPPIKTKKTFDGLGRLSQTTAVNNATTETTYDALGRVYSVTTPHFTSPSSTDGTTTYSYDPLGRKLTETHPDGNYLQWSPSGSTTVYRDEDGNQWQQTVDGLGRLTNVVERYGTPFPLTTMYGYDSLGNLTSVNQQGNGGTDVARVRSFTYDYLSRLVQAYNPESGWTCYGTTPGNASPNGTNCTAAYDGDGNLKYKTDARGIQTAYNYDAQSHLLSKTYSYGTLSSCYEYGNPGGAANSAGHLVASWTQPGACASDSSNGSVAPPNAVTWQGQMSYDAMGQLQQAERCTGATACTAQVTRQTQYTYDLAGNQTSSGDGFSSRIFSYHYNPAGLLSNFGAGSLGAEVPLFSVPTYWPTGQWSSATFGSQLGATQTFDDRMRVTGKSVFVP